MEGTVFHEIMLDQVKCFEGGLSSCATCGYVKLLCAQQVNAIKHKPRIPETMFCKAVLEEGWLYLQ